jgi:hypothetical protein
MADGDHPHWPPEWPVDEDEADGVGKIVRLLNLDEQQYRELVALAERLLADPDFQRLMYLIARALDAAPVLDRESVEILRIAAGIPNPIEGVTP